jgi:hypothetical protein
MDQFMVRASNQSSILQFGFRNDQNAFALDDITVVAIPAPLFQAVQAGAGSIVFAWSTTPGVTYQVQYAYQLNASLWADLGEAVKATSNTLTVSDKLASHPQRFYRIVQPQ